MTHFSLYKISSTGSASEIPNKQLWNDLHAIGTYLLACITDLSTKAKSLKNDQHLSSHLLSIISVQRTDALIVTISMALLTGLLAISVQNDVLQYIPKDLFISAVQMRHIDLSPLNSQ